jgi:hypothetical protein
LVIVAVIDDELDDNFSFDDFGGLISNSFQKLSLLLQVLFYPV